MMYRSKYLEKNLTRDKLANLLTNLEFKFRADDAVGPQSASLADATCAPRSAALGIAMSAVVCTAIGTLLAFFAIF